MQEDEQRQDLYTYQVRTGQSFSPVVVVGINGTPLSMHLDTQADVTVITEKHLKDIQVTNGLQPTPVAIRSYSGEEKGPELPMAGRFFATLARGKEKVKEMVYVAKGQGDVALLSRHAAENMGLVEYHIDKTTSQQGEESSGDLSSLLEEYADVFTGIGRLIDVEVKLHVDLEAEGVVQKQRRIPISLKEKFEEILDK